MFHRKVMMSSFHFTIYKTQNLHYWWQPIRCGKIKWRDLRDQPWSGFLDLGWHGLDKLLPLLSSVPWRKICAQCPVDPMWRKWSREHQECEARCSNQAGLARCPPAIPSDENQLLCHHPAMPVDPKKMKARHLINSVTAAFVLSISGSIADHPEIKHRGPGHFYCMTEFISPSGKLYI